jgi:hypothetical protein
MGHYGNCQNVIKDKLVDPQSAEFTHEGIYKYKESGNISHTVIKVRATNSFGAYVNQEWTCRFLDQKEKELIWAGPS